MSKLQVFAVFSYFKGINMSKSSMILLAGRYRSGADENVRLAEAQGLPGDHKLDYIARAVS